jgi:hypothetical protein
MQLRAPLRGIVFTLLFALPVFGAGQWTINGPDGGNVRRLLFDPNDSSIVYAGATNGLFRSADGGRHWNAAPALLGTIFLDLAIAGSDSTNVFAASPSGLYKSSDRGVTWQMIQSAGSFHLAVSAQNPKIVYSVSITGLVRSADGGATFESRGSGLPAGLATGIALDPHNDSIVYAAFPSSAGIYKTTDGGAHWVQSNSGLTAAQVFSLAVDPSDGATLYAGASTIFKSSDGAASWTPLTTGYSDLACSGLQVSPSTRTTILAATNHGALLSTDGGSSWHRGAGLLDAVAVAVAFDPHDASTFLAAAFVHVNRSTDGGATTSRSESGLTSFSAQSIAADAHDDAVIYAAGPAGVARSADRGRTWSLSTALQPSKIAIDANASTLYAVSGTVQRSVDGANTWLDFGAGLPGVSPQFIAADPQLSGTLYAIVNGAVYKKTGDDAWIKRSNGLADSMDSVTVDPRSSSTLYAAGPAGVFKSVDGAATWVAANTGLTGLNAVGVAIDPYDSRHLFAWSPTQAFESTDGAATWLLRSGVRGDLFFDSSAPGVVIANPFNDVKRSTDGGRTFQSLAQGLPPSHSLFAMGAGGTLYLGDSSGGVFVFNFNSASAKRRTAGRP